ncbi:MAG TPA: RpiB/LacA/LacB family sugar-phosphate isomerase [Candidatus Saccharimonadales bacterium]|nr:RpiB/LacA/LacB family sugar-phosphate isomerase [Candidatus Saccharimonadales bacterium]
MKIAVTTDHTGLAYADAFDQFKAYIVELGHEVVDFGPKELDMDDDYPDFMFPAAHAVANGECEAGIIMGGSGQGEAMAVNRVKGVRCTVFYAPALAKQPIDAEGNMSDDPYEILKLSRQHNHANMLSLSSRFLTVDEMKQAIKIWLETPYSDVERHARRVRKLDEMA